jgi:hypothetical protein
MCSQTPPLYLKVSLGKILLLEINQKKTLNLEGAFVFHSNLLPLCLEMNMQL